MASQLILSTVVVVVLAQASLAMPAQSVKQEALATTQVEDSEEAAKTVDTGNSNDTAAQTWKDNSITITAEGGYVVIKLHYSEFTGLKKDERYRHDNIAASNTNGSAASAAYANQNVSSNNEYNSTANE